MILVRALWLYEEQNKQFSELTQNGKDNVGEGD